LEGASKNERAFHGRRTEVQEGTSSFNGSGKEGKTLKEKEKRGLRPAEEGEAAILGGRRLDFWGGRSG